MVDGVVCDSVVVLILNKRLVVAWSEHSISTWN